MAGNSKRRRVSAGTKKKLMLQEGIGANRFSGLKDTNILYSLDNKGKDRLKDIIHVALEQLKERKLCTVGWGNLQYRLYLGAGLAKTFFEKEIHDYVIKAINSLFEIQDRWIRSGSTIYAAKPEEIDDLENAINLIDNMQDQCTRRELVYINQRVEVFLKKSNGNRITRNGILVAE